MSSLLILILSTFQLPSIIQQNHTYSYNWYNEYDIVYYVLPRFWANVGFCPAGNINHANLSENLLSDAVQMNLRHIGALPMGSVKHVRVHWLLELIEFVAYSQAGVPIYDFTLLDIFLENLMEYGLTPTIEFMCNPGDIFIKNPNKNALLWENFAFQMAHHFLALFGAKDVVNWRFETWNEPDLMTYNRLNFNFDNYLEYALAVRRGLNLAAQRVSSNLHLSLHGPAGLFRNESHHPLCWHILQFCHADKLQCPFNTLTYHRKGNATELLWESDILLKTIHERFSNLRNMPVANNEADPIVNWARPQEFHADVRYAWLLMNIVLDHWSAKLKNKQFEYLSYISHDNAFLSFHPHEFTQRTLLAHFRMNNSIPVHSQFIKKPVYMALSLLSRLGSLASDIEILPPMPEDEFTIRMLKTTVAGDSVPLQLSWLLLPTDNPSMKLHNFSWHRKLPLTNFNSEEFAFGLDLLAKDLTDPYLIWQQNGRPPYPNPKLRELMRRAALPRLQQYGSLQVEKLYVSIKNLKAPWILLLRVCSKGITKAPHSLMLTPITQGEIFINWQEDENTTICLKTYELWFSARNDTENWQFISNSWHLPFPSFQYAPETQIVSGFYKVRSQNLFDEYSEFSKIVEYYEI